MEIYAGSCHCGNVTFEVAADLDVTRILDCNCSICRRKGFLHLIVESERFELLGGREHLREYRFNTGQAQHLFCSECGIHPFYVPRSHPDKIDVNVRCLPAVDLDSLTVEPFDGQNWEDSVEDIRE